MRKHILVIAALTALTAAAGGGIAIASHVTEVDPATVPVGFLAAHNRVGEVPISAFARAAAADGAEVTVQHIRLSPNQPIPWHTHPGPVFVTIAQGELTYVSADDCVGRQYGTGTAFVDPGHGHVHTAYNSGSEGTVFVATFFEAPETGPITIPATGDCPIPAGS